MTSLEKHLSLNRAVWEELTNSGFDASQAVDLDFYYNTNDPRQAQALCRWLRETYQYQADAYNTPKEGEMACVIQVQLKRTRITPQWIDEMVTLWVGIGESFRCEFGGWGIAWE
jgi:hypothetical protein